MVDLIKATPEFLDKESCKAIIDSYGDSELEKSSNPNLIKVTDLIKQAMLEKIVFYLKTYPNFQELENVNISEALRILHQTAYLFGGKDQKATIINSAFSFNSVVVEGPELNIIKLDSESLESELGSFDTNNSIKFLTFLGEGDAVIVFKKINAQFNLNPGDLLVFPASWIFDFKLNNNAIVPSYLISNTIAFDLARFKNHDF